MIYLQSRRDERLGHGLHWGVAFELLRDETMDPGRNYAGVQEFKEVSQAFFALHGHAENHRYLPDRNSSSINKFDTVNNKTAERLKNRKKG